MKNGLKTMEDLERMKDNKMQPFENQYVHLFLMLEDFYISKYDGLDRIKIELQNWDKEAQEFICNELIKNISQINIVGFDEKDILSLIE